VFRIVQEVEITPCTSVIRLQDVGSKLLRSNYQSTRPHIPENSNLVCGNFSFEFYFSAGLF